MRKLSFNIIALLIWGYIGVSSCFMYAVENGRYVCKNKLYRIEVADDSMMIFSHYYKDMKEAATVCDVHKLNCGYYKISSKFCPMRITESDGLVIQSGDMFPKDTVKVTLSFPFLRQSCKVVINYMGESVSSDYDGDSMRDICLKFKKNKYCRDSDKFTISLIPDTYNAILPNNQYGGVVYFNTDPIEIKLPEVYVCLYGIDDNYFSRLFVNGDYVRIESDKLIWRGVEFIKTEKYDR